MAKTRDFYLKYENGTMIIKCDDDKGKMATTQEFKMPLKIDLRAKTDSTNIRLSYGCGEVFLNWEGNKDDLYINDILSKREYKFIESGRIPENEFIDIEWILELEYMALRINGEIRQIGNTYDYIKKFVNDVDFNFTSVFSVAVAMGSTVTVASLVVIELKGK